MITIYTLGNQEIKHIVFGPGNEFKARRDAGTANRFWVYWAESYTWAVTIPDLVRRGELIDKVTGPYGHVTTYLA